MVSGTRKLYVTSGASVISYAILDGGTLGSPIVLTTNPESGGSCEAEVSPDGNWIAWGSVQSGTTPSVYVRSTSTALLNPTPFTPVFASGTTSGVSGLEFSGDSKRLFIAGGGGAAVYTLATGAQALLNTGSNTLAGNTQLELAFDGLIYGASSTGRLLTIDPGTLAVTASPLPFSTFFTSNTGTGGPSVYAFPDQVDGENYTTYYGNNTPTVSAGLAMNGRLLQTSYVSAVYSCNPPMLLNAFGANSADITRFDVVINSTDAAGGVTSTYAYTSATATLPVDLSALDGGYLASPAHTGYYQVRLVGYNACQSAQTTARMQVSTLTPASAGYAFNLCAGRGPQAGSTSPGAPAALGTAGGGGIDISFSTGDYDSYRVQFEQFANGAFTPIGSLADIAKPTGTGLTSIGITYLAGQTGLGTSYFSQGNPGFNLVHRLTLTVRNACGESPPLPGYFQTSNTLCRTAPTTTTAPTKAPFYPNPLTGGEAGHLRFTLPTAQPVSLVLTDALTGKVRLTVLHDALRAAGEQEVAFDAAKLPAGVYLYRLTTAGTTTVGRVLKAE